ncbi:rhodanese-like domain-containing protein [Thalassotalea euphylliae]|nr:rhodanese-like domain-containing protein [Thalassotalea euphylliae]
MKMTPAGLVDQARQAINEISIEQWQQNAEDFLVIDVRDVNELDKGQLPGASHISRGLLEFQILNHPKLIKLNDIEKAAANILLYCQSGGRSALAAQSLMNMGFNNVTSLAGGYNEWLKLTAK